MSCYRPGGCGPYEYLSCYECPASKPEYLQKRVTLDNELVPVVHGRWVVNKKKDTFGFTIDFRCDVCKQRNEHGSPYCPNCGAKMDLER